MPNKSIRPPKNLTKEQRAAWEKKRDEMVEAATLEFRTVCERIRILCEKPIETKQL